MGLRAIHREALQRLFRAALSDVASPIFSSNGSLEQAAKFYG
jgi:hypothetical protein